jgi:hypothetical protein
MADSAATISAGRGEELSAELPPCGGAPEPDDEDCAEETTGAETRAAARTKNVKRNTRTLN